MPCSPDCPALNADGSRDEVQCKGCDAIERKSKLFNDKMTLSEAGKTLLTVYNGKTLEEHRLIFDEYISVLADILKNELDLAEQGWM